MMTDETRRKFFRLLALMEEMGACDMGDLTYKQASRFHAATDKVRSIIFKESDQ
jgi:hypothetical protein